MPKSKEDNSSRGRNWNLTFHNPVEGTHFVNVGLVDAELMFSVPVGKACPVRGVHWQIEICPTTGTRHIQAFLQTGNPVTMQGLKRLLGAHFKAAHLDPVTAGTAHQAAAYANKEDTRERGPFQEGELKFQGQRTDVMSLREAALSLTTEQLWDEHFDDMMKNHRAIETYRRIKRVQLARPRKRCVVLYGSPGSGKSTLAAAFVAAAFPDEKVYYKSNAMVWWDGYHGQKVVIWDDFKGSGCNVDEAKLILDRTPCTVQVKGSSVNLEDEVMIITTNHPIKDWWLGNDKVGAVDIEAIQRRVTVIPLLVGGVEERIAAWAKMNEVFGQTVDVDQSWLNLPTRPDAPVFDPVTVPFQAPVMDMGVGILPMDLTQQLGLGLVNSTLSELPDFDPTMGGFFNDY